MFWNNWISTCKKIKLDTFLTSLPKIALKWIIYLNIRGKIIKLFKENKFVSL